MTNELQLVLDFVQGRLEAVHFAQHFYRNDDFKRLLSTDPDRPRHLHAGQSVYDVLLTRSFTNPDDLAIIHHALIRYLDRHGIRPIPTSTYDDQFDLILAAQPVWLSVAPVFLEHYLFPYAGERTNAQFVQWLGQQLREYFRYLVAPPEWIQHPDWPIGLHGPLVFLGQIPVPNYFHDDAAAYVFHDPVDGSTETIIQTF